MHGERDIMHRFVFPELKRRARYLNVDLIPIDLRWGINTSEDSNYVTTLINGNNKDMYSQRKQLEACLEEIDRSNIFVGMLGMRYGSKPMLKYTMTSKLQKKLESIPNMNLEDVYDGNMSITDIEMRYAMSKRKETREKSLFFFLRKDTKNDISNVNKENIRLANLKSDVMSSQFNVQEYDVNFMENGSEGKHKLQIEGMKEFGILLQENLWQYVKESRLNLVDENLENSKRIFEEQETFANLRVSTFLGRKKLIDSSMENVLKICKTGGAVNFSATKPGIGATSLLCKIYKNLKQKRQFIIIPYFFPDDVPNDSNENDGKNVSFMKMLSYIYNRLTEILGISCNHENLEGLSTENLEINTICKNLSILLQNFNNVSMIPNLKIVIIVDGLEHVFKSLLQDINNKRSALSLQNLASGLLQWLPQTMPSNVNVIISSNVNSYLCKGFGSYFTEKVETLPISGLDYTDRKEIAKSMLKEYGKVLCESSFNNQLGNLISKREAGNVTYLKLLCDEMASFGVYEKLDAKLNSIGETTEKILDEILERAENEIGKELVVDIINIFLATELTGINQPILELTLSKLQEFRKNHQNKKESGSCPKINSLQISVALGNLNEFICPTKGSFGEGMLQLKAGTHLKIVKLRYLQNQQQCVSQVMSHLHKVLSDVFLSVYVRDLVDAAVNPAILRSLMVHLSSSDDTTRLESHICSLQFIRQCALSGKYSLKCLQTLLTSGIFFHTEKVRIRFLSSPKVSIFSTFIDKNIDSLSTEPSLLVQLGLNEPDGSYIRKETIKWLNSESDSSLINPSKYFVLNEKGKKPLNFRDLVEISSRKISTNTQITSTAVEESRPDIDIENLLSAHGQFDGSIIISLALNNSELFRLLGSKGSPIR